MGREENQRTEDQVAEPIDVTYMAKGARDIKIS